MFWILIILLSVLIVLLLLDRSFKNEQFDKIPGPPGVFLAANALDFLMDSVKLFKHIMNLCKVYRGIFRIKLGPKRICIIHSPEDVAAIISGSKHNKKGFLYGFIEPWLQQGLLLSVGSKWQLRRKILTPTFHFNILKEFSKVLEENSRKLVKKLEIEVRNKKTNISSYIFEFTLNSICETAMGTKLDQETSHFAKTYKNGIHTLGTCVVYRAQRIWMYSNYIFPMTEVGRKQKKILDLLSSFRNKVVEQRRQFNKEEEKFDGQSNSNKKRLAFLDLLLQAEKEGQIDAKGIGEEVDTFMFEGHDTTATALQFALMLFANNPEAQEKVFQECVSVMGESTDSNTTEVTIADLSQLKYLECCIKETMRLYPPVFFIMRYIEEPIKLGDYEIPANTDCTIMIYDLHRRDDQYEDPLEFKPERFMKEPTWHPFAYIPFSAGPRNCIGQKFAMIEMKLALSAILRNYRLHPVTKPEDVLFVADFILRSKEPIYVQLEKRNTD